MILAALAVFASTAHAQSPASRLQQIETDIETVAQRLNLVRTTFVAPVMGGGEYLTENRLADGRLLFLLGDYLRASIVFMDIVENTGNRRSRSFQDARFYLGESLFGARNLAAARGFYEEIAEDRGDPHYVDALRRLLEISFMTRHYDGVDEVYSALRADREARNRPDVIYIGGKTLYFQGDYVGAVGAFSDVPPDSLEYVQAQYFLGTTYVQMGEWDRAITSFQTAREQAGDSEHPESGQIRELATLAVGRVHYELGDTLSARDAYQSVSRDSDLYDTALYEMGWTYIIEERYRDALQTLDILLLAVPDSQFRPNAQLLRGDLLIRMSRYQQALTIFDATVEQFTPLAEQLSMVIQRDGTPDEYFDALVDSASASLLLPNLAREWVEDDESMHRALDLVQDLEFQTSEVQDSQEIIEDLRVVLNSSSRIDVFPELRDGYGQGLELQIQSMRYASRLLEAERELILPSVPQAARAGYESIREQRRALWAQIASMPSTFEEMAAQEAAVEQDLQAMEMEVFRLGYEIESQRAQLTALRLQIREEHAAGSRTAEEFQAGNQQLDLFEGELEQLETIRDTMRQELERQRLATGLGSVAAGSQEELQQQFRELVSREVSSLAGFRSGASDSASAQLSTVDRLRRRLDSVVGDLDMFFVDLNQVVDDQTRNIRRQIDVENAMLQDYDRQLREFGVSGQGLAGEIAFSNFIDVQNQFNELILRADVGIIDVAWREKEDRTTRINSLFEERNLQLRVLDSEFREVLESD